MTLPDRIGGLIARIEAGQTVTQDDVDRLATLQTLDLAKLGEDFARATIARDDELTKALAEA
jgi:hypothetical protein